MNQLLKLFIFSEVKTLPLDINAMLQSIINLFAGVAVIVSVATIIIGVILRTRGSPRANSTIFYGFLALLVALLGWPLINWLFSGYSISPPQGVPSSVWGVVVYALSAIMIITSAIYIALGRVEEGAWSFVAAILVLGLLGIGFTAMAGGAGAPAGTLKIDVSGNTVVNTDQNVTLIVSIPNAVNPVYINVSWGDGSWENITVYDPSKPVRFIYKYDIGNVPSANFTVVIRAVELGTNRTGVNVLGVVVINPNYCPIGWPLNGLCGFLRSLSQVPVIGALFTIDFQKLVMSPLFPTNPSDPIYGIYATLFQLSLLGVGAFIAFSIAWSVTTSETPKAVVSSIKDAVLALLLALLAPYIYNATASVLNTVVMAFIGQGYAIQAMAIGIYALATAFGAIFGYFLPYLANMAAGTTLLLLIANIIVLFRWALMLAIVAVSPLLALAYIHPALKNAAKGAIGVLAGLMLAGPIAAIALAVLGRMLGDASAGLAFPIFVEIMPTMLGMFGGGAAAGLGAQAFIGIRRLGSPFTPSMLQAGGRMKLPTPTPIPTTVPTTVAMPSTARAPSMRIAPTTATSGGIVPPTPPPPPTEMPSTGAGEAGAAPYRPAITFSDISKARQEAELKRMTLEGLAQTPKDLPRFFAEAEAEQIASEKAWQKLDDFERDVLTSPKLQKVVGEIPTQMARDIYEGHVAEEKAKILSQMQIPEVEKVHPRLEAFKHFINTLSTKASRQVWSNFKTFVKDYALIVAHRLNITLPRPYEHHYYYNVYSSLNELAYILGGRFM